MDKILNYIKEAFAYIKNFVVRIINGCINFVRNVIGWFKSLPIKQGRDVPFIANANKQEFKALLKKAPTKDVGIFQGVYNEVSDEITYNEYLDADAVDQQTKNVLGNEELVVLG